MGYGQYSQQEKPFPPRLPEGNKRIKHIFGGSKDSDIEHVWAHPETFPQDWASNPQKNLYYKTDSDGTRVLYSYRDSYPIASMFIHRKRRIYLVLSGKGYSVTTSSHMNRAYNAVPDKKYLFSVPCVTAHYFDHEPDKEAHLKNLADYGTRINHHLLKSARARLHKEWDYATAVRLRAEAIKYAIVFRLKYAGIIPTIPALGSEAIAEIKRLENKRIADERKRVMQENAEAIAKWRNGERVSLPYNLPDMLRIASDGVTVETSRGVRFPASHAKRGLALIRAVRERGEDWHTNGHTCHLGDYSITSIDAQGNVVAGCHRVAWSEIERIAPKLDALQEGI